MFEVQLVVLMLRRTWKPVSPTVLRDPSTFLCKELVVAGAQNPRKIVLLWRGMVVKLGLCECRYAVDNFRP